MASNDRVHFKIALPTELKARIERYAKENRRSLSAEMIGLLEYALWYEDQARMNAGMEPFREVTERDRETIELGKRDMERREARKAEPPSRSIIEDLESTFPSPERLEELRRDLRKVTEMLERLVDLDLLPEDNPFTKKARAVRLDDK